MGLCSQAALQRASARSVFPRACVIFELGGSGICTNCSNRPCCSHNATLFSATIPMLNSFAKCERCSLRYTAWQPQRHRDRALVPHMSRHSLIRWVFALFLGILGAFVCAGPACVLPYAMSKTVRVGDEASQIHERIGTHLHWPPMVGIGPHQYDSVTCEIMRGFGFTHFVFVFKKREPSKIRGGRVIEWTASTTGQATVIGWPFRWLLADNLSFFETQSNQPSSNLIDRIREVIGNSRLLFVPFMANVMLLTLAARFLPGLPRRLRGVYWVKSGRCPACGYPRGQSSACSECGHAF